MYVCMCIDRLQRYNACDRTPARLELSQFVWSSAREARKLHGPERSGARERAWIACKGLLKDLIDFNKFNAGRFNEDCVQHVLEDHVLRVLQRYRTFVLTGRIETRNPPPKFLSETGDDVCVDKPCQHICLYGNNDEGKPPELSPATSSLMLLDQEQPQIQNHQYLALNYDFETALGWHRRAALDRNPTAARRPANRNARALDTPFNIG